MGYLYMHLKFYDLSLRFYSVSLRKVITRPSFQEETGIVLGLVFPSSSNRPLVLKAHACTGALSRDRFPTNSLAQRQNHFEMLSRTRGSFFCRSVALTLWFCCLYERSTIILVEMFSDMCCLEDNVSRNCQTNTVARSV